MPDHDEAGERRPADTAWKQQRLWAWQPILSPQWVISFFFFISAIFIVIGALVIDASNAVQEVEFRYDDHSVVKNCRWIKREADGTINPGCLRPCNAEPCQFGTEECGMIGNLGPGCPRNFDSVFEGNKQFSDLTLNDIKAMSSCDPKCVAEVTFVVTETLDPPVYLYYKLTSFYQNHRRYAKSRSDGQLSGESGASVTDCSPYTDVGDLTNKGWCQENFNRTCGSIPIPNCPASEWVGDKCNPITTVPPDATIGGNLRYSPCGLISWSKFNDSFILRDNSSTVICDGDAPETPTCQKTGIAWDADRDSKFKEPKGAGIYTYKGMQEQMDTCGSGTCPWAIEGAESTLPFLYHGWYWFEPYHKVAQATDENTMVWMRTASLPKFRKLYRRIEQPLPAGTYHMTINHRFDVDSFSGEKYFILSTFTWIGGKNYFLGGTYVAIGCCCFVLTVIFLVKHIFFRTSRAESMATFHQRK